jgi:leader peptidase (prepilin peptidase) / N-methyltransferase
LFMGCWVAFGERSVWIALAYAAVIAGLIVATFIDFEHFIIPDEITIGGMIAGVCVSLMLPSLHGVASNGAGLLAGLIGAAVGFGIVYAIVRLGKLLFGRKRVELPADTRIVFSETAVHLPDRDVPYDELFYRDSDVIVMQARTLEMIDRGYMNVTVRLTPKQLMVGEEVFNPEQVHQMEAVSSEIVLPQEAMGFGDVKFMGAIGAFLGWQSTLFALMVSSCIGAVVGLGLIVIGRREWSSRLPYGPYIALAALIWMFLPPHLQATWKQQLLLAVEVFSAVFR